VLRRSVTGWRQSIVREGYSDVWFLAGYIRSSEMGTETFWIRLDAVDRQRGNCDMLGHLFDTVNRQRRRTEMFGYWVETVDRQRGILRRLVTG